MHNLPIGNVFLFLIQFGQMVNFFFWKIYPSGICICISPHTPFPQRGEYLLSIYSVQVLS